MLTTLVGLIAFASPDKSLLTPTSMFQIATHLLNFLYREQSCIRDKVYGAVVRRASCHGFCIAICQLLHREQLSPFTGTQPSWQFYRDSQIIATYRDYAKTHANPDTDGN